MRKINMLTISLISALLIGAWSILAWQYLVTTTRNADNDYTTFYITFRHNKTVYQDNYFAKVVAKKEINGKTQIKTSTPLQMINLNSPPMSLFLKGLLNISNQLKTNVAIWIGASLIFAALGIWIALPNITSNSKSIFLPALLLFLLSQYSLEVMTTGQMTFLLLPILSLAYRFCCEKRQNELAISIGVLSALKLFFLVFIFYFIMKKAWPQLAIMITSFALLFFAPIFYFKTNTYLQFFTLTQHFFIFFTRSVLPHNGSLLGFIANLCYILKSKMTLLELRYFTYLVAIYFLIRSMIYDHQVLQTLPRYTDELRFSLYIIIALACSPLAWIYYYPFFLIPFITFFQIQKTYKFSNFFYVCLFASLTLTVIPGTEISRSAIDNASWIFLLKQLSAVSALLLWLTALIIAASSIQKERYHDKKAPELFLPVYIAALIITLLYSTTIKLNPTYFILWNKKTYLETAKPFIILKQNIKSKTNTGIDKKNPYNLADVKKITKKNTH